MHVILGSFITDYFFTIIIIIIMQLQIVRVLERGIMDNPLTFDVSLIQLSLHTGVFT